MKKSSRLGMRINPAKKVKWEEAAAERGVSLSTYIESCVDAYVRKQQRVRDAEPRSHKSL